MSYRYWGNIKALFHFDFPYIFEPGDGLRDEVSGLHNIFTREGNIKLAGNETAEDIIEASVGPKFGYRCLHSNYKSDAIVSSYAVLLALLNSGDCEIEFFAKFTGNYQGDFLSFYNAAGNKIPLLSLSINALSLYNSNNTFIVNFNQWYHIKVRLHNNYMSLFVNNSEVISVAYNGSLNAAKISFGGVPAYFDELVFREDISDNSVPSVPYQAALNINNLGSFGTGALGDVIISANAIINSYGLINSVSGRNINIPTWTAGKFGVPKAGDEILIHVSAKKNLNENLLGLYSFRTISSVSQNSYTLDSAVDEFDLADAINNYYVQAVSVPHFKTLTINKDITINPLAYSEKNHYGGIIAFRTKGDCELKAGAKIISIDYGLARTDFIQMTNSDLIDRFLFNLGGGIFITCGNKFIAPSGSYIGASWSGAEKAGVGAARSRGTNGGCGYGGGGGGDDDSNTAGGNGGVGGGGGGHDSSPGNHYNFGGDAGVKATGGYGFTAGSISNEYQGGTQGVTQGGNGLNYRGGGGALGNGGVNLASSGACLILIAKNLSVDQSAISTGGKGGTNRSYRPEGGGGTGLCYIACENVR